MKSFLFIVLVAFVSFNSYAGVDLTGKIKLVWLDEDDKLWFRFDNPNISQYCKSGWMGLNAYVEKSDKDFPYYYGLINTALSSGQTVRLSNINTFNGSTGCDIVKTNYGIVVYAP